MKKDVEIEFNFDRLLAGAEEVVAHKGGKIKLRTWSIDPNTGERGLRRPAGAAQRLLQIADRAPELLMELV